ncbi:ABC transporter ATP-binding protein/permease [Anaerococcus murdochii]|uniref:ABC transporter ATP-binding protein/permease n=1 Tax=Anaerococcus murdochii TaxID=411577 RepID=A0ABS7SWM9_9FIRM|nr:ABC transporter ATP-binding protein [Anaerococcus murdochii]MBZ2385947.1 ABC transporter ATP-binding protein/permease [Anaerococcus murdochii]
MTNDYKMNDKSYRRKVSFSSIGRLLSYLFAYRWQMILIVVCVIVSALTQIWGVNMLQPIIDNYILQSDVAGLKRASLQMGAIYAVSALTSFIYSRLMVRVGERSIRNIRVELFDKVQKMPIGFFDTNKHGEIMSRFTNDTDVLSQALANTVPTIVRATIMLVGTILVMFKLSFNLTLTMLLGLLILIPILSRIIYKSSTSFREGQGYISSLQGFSEETLSGQKVVKVFSREEKILDTFRNKTEEVRIAFTRANTYAGRMMPFLLNMVNILYAAITVYGVYLTIQGDMTVGVLAAFLSNIRQIQNPIVNVSQQANAVFQAMAGADRIFEIIDMPIEKDTGFIELVHAVENADGSVTECDDLTGRYAWVWDDGDRKHYKMLEGRLEFKNVDFSYDGKNQILKDISFYADPGEKIAFVGSTGAGKTTITNVITRFYEIDNGSIMVDGIDIRDIKKDALRRAFGMVLQEVNLFTDTIEGNIKYGRLRASDEEVKAAARLSGADSFIKRLPEKYDTEIHGDGSSLSDGQNQLISISRAAIAEPPMLILDEATSSIDTATEKDVTEAMDKLMTGSTSIVIAHRLSTIQNSDVIMVMEDGRIIERGNHDKLIKEKGTYWQLYTGKLELD